MQTLTRLSDFQLQCTGNQLMIQSNQNNHFEIEKTVLEYSDIIHKLLKGSFTKIAIKSNSFKCLLKESSIIIKKQQHDKDYLINFDLKNHEIHINKKKVQTKKSLIKVQDLLMNIQSHCHSSKTEMRFIK